jgi:uncharacterized heparinase superfamily protein
MTSLRRRLIRSIDFARHVPARQLGRRLWLVGRRRLEQRLKPRFHPGPLRLASDPPKPLFAPRRGAAERTEIGWRFGFLGRSIAMPEQIDWTAPGPDAADQLWRMNLHYMEYLEELDDAAAADAVKQWIAANPPHRRAAQSDAWNAYAVSLRVAVWIQQMAARPALATPAAIGSLGAQLRFLETHLETDVGGNHLIKNIKALILGSCFFAGPAAERWRRKGIALLRRELPVQVLPDGVHFELSPSYHCQVFADLLEIRAALADGALEEILAMMVQPIANLAHPDGMVAQFGDAGLHMAYCQRQCLEAYGHTPVQRPVFAFPSAGYYGARGADSYIIADAGIIAPDRLPAHGHGDMLSFEWSLGGERIVVDQGVFEYVAGGKRHVSRSARNHNTLVVDGGDQAEFFGAFRSAARARPRLVAWEPAEDGFVLEAAHDGFRRLPGRPIHRRRFSASPERIRIEDRIEGGSERPARIAMLLSPKAKIDRLGAGKLGITCGKASATITGSADLAVEEAVWWPDMGVEYPTSRIVMTLEAGQRSAWLELGRATGGDEGMES